jgi:hypothetical protein
MALRDFFSIGNNASASDRQVCTCNTRLEDAVKIGFKDVEAVHIGAATLHPKVDGERMKKQWSGRGGYRSSG